MNKERKAIIQANKVSRVEELNLGGIPQKVLIEGKNEDLPVVITLHGGPGTPVPFSDPDPNKRQNVSVSYFALH